jgi:hypothetical protein
MTTVAEVSESVAGDPAPVRAPHALRNLLIVVAVVVVLALAWVYRYNPLIQSWHQEAGGEWGSYVGKSGVEAHHSMTNTQGSPIGTEVWVEPSGKFFVEIETEITNNGTHAVRINRVGQPSFDYRTSGYRVSFYRNANFPNEGGAKFHSFVLAGHSQRMVVVSYSQYCATSAPNSETIDGVNFFSGMTGLPVTYSFEGFSHTDVVPVEPTEFQAPSSC